MSFEQTIKLTSDWYEQYFDGKNLENFTIFQIKITLKNFMKKNKLKKKKLDDVKIIKSKIFNDHRGKFNKVFSNKLFPFLKKQSSFIKEVNYCITKKKGTIRGMHFQYGSFKEDKIVTCLNGEIFRCCDRFKKKF